MEDNFTDMDKERVKQIIGDNKRFRSPYDEPYGYFLFLNEDETVTETITETYFEKLKYAVENTDFLIKSSFTDDLYDFYGVRKKSVKSPKEMCSGLIVDSFVLVPSEKRICCSLSNEEFMWGHAVEVGWNYEWELAWLNIC